MSVDTSGDKQPRKSQLTPEFITGTVIALLLGGGTKFAANRFMTPKTEFHIALEDLQFDLGQNEINWIGNAFVLIGAALMVHSKMRNRA